MNRILWADDEIHLLKPYIINKQEKGYEVKLCSVTTQVSTNENEETKINKIKVNVDKTNDKNKIEDKNTESKIVTEIQKIKKIDTNIGEDKHENEKQENKNILRKREWKLHKDELPF